jgi:DNA invertase Pin-like site-specific DNA recombinase
MPTIAYIRVSTERQSEEGNGLEQQRRSICAFAAASGMTIDEWVTDDETGTTEDREGIQNLLGREGQFTLIFDRIDRLGRTLLVAESLFAKFSGRGVRLVCVAQQLDDSPVGRLTRQIMGAFAEFQRSELLARLAQCKRAAKAKRGTFGGGTVAYGYRAMGGGKLAVDPCTITLVRRCHELGKQEGATYRSIASELTKEGFTTRKGTTISAAQVWRILEREETYRGNKNVGSVPLDAGVKPVHAQLLP